jgi:hypothetical protein
MKGRVWLHSYLRRCSLEASWRVVDPIWCEGVKQERWSLNMRLKSGPTPLADRGGAALTDTPPPTPLGDEMTK